MNQKGIYFSMRNVNMLSQLFSGVQANIFGKKGSKRCNIFILNSDFKRIEKKAQSRNDKVTSDMFEKQNLIKQLPCGIKLDKFTKIYAPPESKAKCLKTLGIPIFNQGDDHVVFLLNTQELSKKSFFNASTKTYLDDPKSLAEYQSFIDRKCVDIQALWRRLSEKIVLPNLV